MKIRALANDEIREESDEAANELIDAGIYVRAAGKDKQPTPKAPAKKPEPTKKAPASPTAVSPMGTQDMPSTPKGIKPK